MDTKDNWLKRDYWKEQRKRVLKSKEKEKWNPEKEKWIDNDLGTKKKYKLLMSCRNMKKEREKEKCTGKI